MTTSPASRRPKLCFVATVAMPLKVFMAPHIRRLALDYEVVVVCSEAETELTELHSDHIRCRSVSIPRKPSLWQDMQAWRSLRRLFREEKFDVVYSLMPKSGLLAMTAARAAGVPRRVHCFTGQVWATRQGIARHLLKGLDRILAVSATHLLADSPSQATFLAAEHVTGGTPIKVLGSGSVAGVDAGRFVPNQRMRQRIREELNLPPTMAVGVYVGRLNRDKGLIELARAFRAVEVAAAGKLGLMLVGPDEEGMRALVTAEVGQGRTLHFVDSTPRPEHYFAAADFLVLPSYREGFGTTVIEAAACGLPAIGSRIYGLTDAIVEGQTGLLVPPRDVSALASALELLTVDPELRSYLGARARARALEEFQPARLTALLAEFIGGIRRD